MAHRRQMPLPALEHRAATGEGNDEGDDEGDEDGDVSLVLDAGRLRWRIGLAGEDEPARWTDDLPPQIVAPVLAGAVAADSAECGPELVELAAACAAAAAALPDDWNDGRPDVLHLGEQTRLTGQACRAFGTELVVLAQRGVAGAKRVLWRCNCALLEAFLRLRWSGLSSQFCVLVALPCLQDPACSPLLDELRRVMFGADGPVVRAGRRCLRMSVQPQELLASYGNGRTTALSINLGRRHAATLPPPPFARLAAVRGWPRVETADLVIYQDRLARTI